MTCACFSVGIIGSFSNCTDSIASLPRIEESNVLSVDIVKCRANKHLEASASLKFILKGIVTRGLRVDIKAGALSSET